MSVTSDDFRDVLRHFPSGVTIVTIQAPSTTVPHGLTVSAFASISPQPPLILISIDHHANGHAMLEEEGATFAVNILGEDQTGLSNRFAWVKDEDRFGEGTWSRALTGAMVLEEALAWLDCTIHSRFVAGSHTIYIGEVVASSVQRDGAPPLVYWNRGYRRLMKKAPAG